MHVTPTVWPKLFGSRFHRINYFYATRDDRIRYTNFRKEKKKSNNLSLIVSAIGIVHTREKLRFA